MKEMEPKITGEILGKVIIKLCKSLGTTSNIAYLLALMVQLSVALSNMEQFDMSKKMPHYSARTQMYQIYQMPPW